MIVVPDAFRLATVGKAPEQNDCDEEPVGAAGVLLGEAKPEPFELVHPLTVWVTVYVPVEPTVIDGVVAEVFQSSDPV